jgi:radical SAM superfamily enzyme
VKDTLMADEWIANPMDFELFTLDGYLDFIVRFIERLSPSIVIERFSGEVPPRFLLAPDWSLVRNDQVNQMIEHRLNQLNTWQGKKFISTL